MQIHHATSYDKAEEIAESIAMAYPYASAPGSIDVLKVWNEEENEFEWHVTNCGKVFAKVVIDEIDLKKAPSA